MRHALLCSQLSLMMVAAACANDPSGFAESTDGGTASGESGTGARITEGGAASSAATADDGADTSADTSGASEGTAADSGSESGDDGGDEAMPTIDNTGPEGPLTDIDVSEIVPGGIYSNCRVVGGDWKPFEGETRQAWTWTFDNCEFTGSISMNFRGPDGTRGVYSDELPTLNLTRVSASTLVVVSPVNLNADRCRFDGSGLYTHSGNLDEYADWRHQLFPLTITNSFFWSPYLPSPNHTETWFGAGYPDGIQMTNVTFYQETGPLADSGVTGVTNIHFGPGTLKKNILRRVYFDFAHSPSEGGAPPPSYANITANRGQLSVEDCFVASRGAVYFSKGNPDEDVSQYTFTNCRDIDSGNLLLWDGTGLSDSGSP